MGGGNPFHPWMARAIGGKAQRRDVGKNTMEIPAIHGDPFRPCMYDVR